MKHPRYFLLLIGALIIGLSVLFFVLPIEERGPGHTAAKPPGAPPPNEPQPALVWEDGISAVPGSEPKTDFAQRLQPQSVISRQTAKLPNGGFSDVQLVKTGHKYPLVLWRRDYAPTKAGAVAQLTRELAYPVDHILVQPAPGVTISRLQAATQSSGLKAIRQVGDGLMVSTASPDAPGVEDALRRMKASGLVQIAEPDYMVFTCQELETAQVIQNIDGSDRLFDPVRQDWVDDERLRAPAGSYSLTAAAKAEQAILDGLPDGGRVIHFDPPQGRVGDFRPEVRMHNFVVTTGAMPTSPSSSVYIQNALNSGYPNNGGNYLRADLADLSVLLWHKDQLPFDAVSVDLSEYSTLFRSQKSILFRGTLADGSTVTQSFLLDGIIDGTGPFQDFQTFHFDSSFRDIVKLEATNPNFMLDNLVVVLKGQETPVPFPPELPTIFSVDWNDSPVNALSPVGGAFAPSSHNAGISTVRQAVGGLTDRPLELIAKAYPSSVYMYGQIRFDLARQATKYELEFDVTKVQSDEFNVFLDYEPSPFFVRCNLSTSTVDVENYGSYLYDSKGSSRIKITCDFDLRRVSLAVNGVNKFSGEMRNGAVDLRKIRFSLTDPDGDGGAAIDNLSIKAYGIGQLPEGPRLNLNPANFLHFAPTPIGSKLTSVVMLANAGSEDLVVESAHADDSAIRVKTQFPLTLIPGSKVPIEVEYLPSVTGLYSTTLRFTSNDHLSTSTTLSVIGEGIGVPWISVQPSSLDVATVEGSLGSGAFTIHNSGSGALNWRLVRFNDTQELPAPVRLNDTHFDALWGLQESEWSGCDAVRAWALTTGSASTIVAVIDTGVDLTHPDLQSRLVKNTSEIAGNLIDDDQNGYIDDVDGWDFCESDADPTDKHGHGTHVAGIISATGDNAIGVVGVAPKGAILPIQFMSATGSGFTSDAIKAIDYARLRGARLINASWGGAGYSSMLKLAIFTFQTENRGLVIAAAGNHGTNNDTSPIYPASYLEVLAVAASDLTDGLAGFSNRGLASVALAAPGTYIMSCYRDGQYAVSSGTSMAAPHVTGTAALLLSTNASADAATLRSFLTDWVDFRPSFNGVTSSGGRLNTYRSLQRVPQSWLKLTKTTGSIVPGGSDTISLGVDATAINPGLYSTSLAFATNDPIRGNLFLPVKIRVFAATPVSNWTQDSFGHDSLLPTTEEVSGWAANADPDGDGVANVLEYLLGLSPLTYSRANFTVTAATDGNITFAFTTRKNTSGLNFAVEWSQTMKSGSWTSAGLVVEPTGSTADMTSWKATFADPDFAPPSCFFRVVAAESAEP